MNSSPDLAQQRKNRLQLIAILAIVLIPVLGSTFMYYTGIGMPSGTNNHGDLIDPAINVADMELHQQQDQAPWSWANTGNFRLVLLAKGNCDTRCAELLHNMRQVHVRLAKRASSLERWFIQLDQRSPETKIAGADQAMAEIYPRMERLRGDYQAWFERLQSNPVINTEFNGHQILLIDRRGNVVMAFEQKKSGQEMLDDVEFLIKSTQ